MANQGQSKCLCCGDNFTVDVRNRKNGACRGPRFRVAHRGCSTAAKHCGRAPECDHWRLDHRTAASN